MATRGVSSKPASVTAAAGVRGGGRRGAHHRAAARARWAGARRAERQDDDRDHRRGREGMSVMMRLLPRPDVQFVAVCDVNRGSKDYAEYSDNDLLPPRAELLGPGHEVVGRAVGVTRARAADQELLDEPGHGRARAGRAGGGRVLRGEVGRQLVRVLQRLRDYRELLARQRDLDAVYVATPDHWHAPIAIAAMRAGKHVLGQKPMCHSIGEARRMAAVARETKVATSVMVNNPSSDATRLIMPSGWPTGRSVPCARCTTGRAGPTGRRASSGPRDAQPVPAHLDWDFWLGPAPERPYHRSYQPFSWRGWYDFGCGSFGDMGCYSFAGLFRILDLVPPIAVEASTSDIYEETFPQTSIVHLDFPARGSHAAAAALVVRRRPASAAAVGALEQDERRFRRDRRACSTSATRGSSSAGSTATPRACTRVTEVQTPPRASGRHPPPDHAVNAVAGGLPRRGPGAARELPAPGSRDRSAAPRLPRAAAAGRALRVGHGPHANHQQREGERLVDPPYREGIRELAHGRRDWRRCAVSSASDEDQNAREQREHGHDDGRNRDGGEPATPVRISQSASRIMPMLRVNVTAMLSSSERARSSARSQRAREHLACQHSRDAAFRQTRVTSMGSDPTGRELFTSPGV
jgi:predicted dehydrogenase